MSSLQIVKHVVNDPGPIKISGFVCTLGSDLLITGVILRFTIILTINVLFLFSFLQQLTTLGQTLANEFLVILPCKWHLGTGGTMQFLQRMNLTSSSFGRPQLQYHSLDYKVNMNEFKVLNMEGII
jgi:hypothetical protein